MSKPRYVILVLTPCPPFQSPEFVKAEVIQERRDDEAAVDEIFRAARMK